MNMTVSARMDLTTMIRVAGLCGSLYTQSVSVPGMSHGTLSYRDNSLCTGQESVSVFYRDGNVNHVYVDGSLPGFPAKKDGVVDWYIREDISDLSLIRRYTSCRKDGDCMMQKMVPLTVPVRSVPRMVQLYFTK